MGISGRSVSLIRYRVNGEIEGNFWDVVDDGIRRHAFRRKERPDTDLVGLGWTSVQDFGDTDFQSASYVFGTYVVLGLRIDTARIPKRALELRYRDACRTALELSGQRRLSAAQKRDTRRYVTEKMRSETIPSIQVHDLIWNTATATVHFTFHALKVRECMEDLFKKSFGLTLVPLIPYLRAEEMLEPGERVALEGISAEIW